MAAATLYKTSKPRLVPPFCIQAMQSNTKVIPPSRLHFIEVEACYTVFRKYYDRGDIPAGQAFKDTSLSGTVLAWHIHPEKLDYSFYLPLFFKGLVEVKFPFIYLVRNGIHDMLKFGKNKILPVLPQLILPIKDALSTENPDIILATLSIIQHLLRIEKNIGLALVQYYYVILPVFNTILNKQPDFKNSKGFSIYSEMGRTFELMEKHGGSDAYVNLKYFIPTYESCVFN